MPSGETIHSTGEDSNSHVFITDEERDRIKEAARHSASPEAETIHSTGEDNNSQVFITDEERDRIKEAARHSASPEASGQTPISPEKKAKHNEGFKKCVAGAVVGAMVLALAFSALKGRDTAPTTATESEHLEDNNRDDLSSSDFDNPAPVSSGELNNLKEPSVIPGIAETLDLQDTYEKEAAKGLRDGYGMKGMFLSAKKGLKEAFDFAVASEVAEVYNNNEREMIKGTAENEVEPLSDYIANLSDAVKPAKFKGFGMLEVESKLESMSAEDYDAALKQFKEIMDKALTERVTISGDYQNAYMRLKDESKPATHDNMELVQCVTHEENLEVVRFYWLSEDKQTEIGSMLVKMTPVYDEEGNIISYKGCMQVLTKLGEKPEVYKDIPPIPPNPDNPDKPDESKEWGKGGDPHAGENRKPSDSVNPDTVVTKEENDNTNAGNQGNPASAPGSSSGGSNSSNNERKQGGSNQGSGTKAGNNSAPKGNPSGDNAGNQKQRQSQTTNKAGGDNNSNKAEEQRVKDGDF